MKKHKTGLKFALLMVLSGLGGAALSLVSMGARDELLAFGQSVVVFLQRNAVWGMALVTLVEVCFGLQLRFSARRAVSRALAAPEDDALLDRADLLCDRGIGLMSVCNILSFLCMGVGVADVYGNGAFRLLLLVGLFIVDMVIGMVLTNYFVVLTRELYPEKQASILSMKFHKEWFASCDEAERHQIGQASYTSMRAGQNACAVAALVSILLAMLFNGGIMPIVTVAAVWLTITISYLRAARKFKTV